MRVAHFVESAVFLGTNLVETDSTCLVESGAAKRLGFCLVPSLADPGFEFHPSENKVLPQGCTV